MTQTNKNKISTLLKDKVFIYEDELYEATKQTDKYLYVNKFTPSYSNKYLKSSSITMDKHFIEIKKYDKNNFRPEKININEFYNNKMINVNPNHIINKSDLGSGTQYKTYFHTNMMPRDEDETTFTSIIYKKISILKDYPDMIDLVLKGKISSMIQSMMTDFNYIRTGNGIINDSYWGEINHNKMYMKTYKEYIKDAPSPERIDMYYDMLLCDFENITEFKSYFKFDEFKVDFVNYFNEIHEIFKNKPYIIKCPVCRTDNHETVIKENIECNDECSICMNNKVNFKLSKCNHSILCLECVNQIKKEE